MEKSLSLFVLLPFMTVFFLLNQGNSNYSRTATCKKAYQPTADPKCTDCHSKLIENKTIHAPAKASCETCHQLNLKEHPSNGAKGLNLTENVPELCFNCHVTIKNEVDSLQIVHKAIYNKKSCTYCHSPHSSDENKLLVSEEKKLCLSCHDKNIKSNGEKTVNIKNLLATSKVIHPILENGGCVVCHKPHASKNNYLLIGAFPKGEYSTATTANFAVCWECHNSDLLKEAKTTEATNFRNGDKNLHFVHMNGKNARSCVMCHNIHASNNDHLIEDKVPFGSWNLPIRFIPKENGGSCFPGCHAKKEYTY